MREKNPVEVCENLLFREKDYNTEHSILKSESAVADILLKQTKSMSSVYFELHKKLNETGIWTFLRGVLSVTAGWNPDNIKKSREGKKKLDDVNSAIAAKSAELVQLLIQREKLHGSTGFSSNTHYSVCSVIDKAAEGNAHFKLHIDKKLNELDGFNSNYWPSIADVCNEISKDANAAEIYATDCITDAATSSSRNSLADYCKALIACIEQYSSRRGGHIIEGFKLTDESFATLVNCALELEPDEMIDAQYMKRLRQRLRDESNK